MTFLEFFGWLCLTVGSSGLAMHGFYEVTRERNYSAAVSMCGAWMMTIIAFIILEIVR